MSLIYLILGPCLVRVLYKNTFFFTFCDTVGTAYVVHSKLFLTHLLIFDPVIQP